MRNIEKKDVVQIKKLLQNGKVLAYPTDTVYGLIARYDALTAIEKIYEIKHRDLTKLLPILIGSWNDFELLTSKAVPDDLRTLFLTGKLTLIVPKNTNNLILANAFWKNTTTVAIRFTTDLLLQSIIQETGPLVATSCNISGQSVINDSKDINFPHLEYKVLGKINNAKSSKIFDMINKKYLR